MASKFPVYTIMAHNESRAAYAYIKGTPSYSLT